MSGEWVWILFYGILLLYTAEDLIWQKVSNGNILIGLAAGMIFGAGSGKQVLVRTAGIFLIFLFGMLDLMSMGDLKIWMVITSFAGVTAGCIIVFAACILLLLFAGLDAPEKLRSAIQNLYLSFRAPVRFPHADAGYPFAPFLLAGAVGYRLFMQV